MKIDRKPREVPKSLEAPRHPLLARGPLETVDWIESDEPLLSDPIYLYVDLKPVILSRETQRQIARRLAGDNLLPFYSPAAATVLLLGHFMVGEHEITAKSPLFPAAERLSCRHVAAREQAR